MDGVAFADAKVTLIAGMIAILLETDDEDKLKRVFQESMDAAKDGWTAELNRINRQRRETGSNVEIPQGTAVTRELWIGNISKILKAFGTDERGQKSVRDFFEAMLQRAVTRVDAAKTGR